MTAVFHKIKLTEIDNQGCNDTEAEYFTNIFIHTVEKMIPTLAREAWFHTSDFADDENHYNIHNIENFALLITRKTICNKEQWRGVFIGEKRRLRLAALEND